MMLRWLLATLHLLALGIGMGAIWVRGRSPAGRPRTPAMPGRSRASAPCKCS